MKRFIFILLVLIVVFPGNLVFAQSFPRQIENVYTGEVFDGNGYYATFYPASVKTLYIIAGVDNVLEARQTQVYYWPLTSEYKADWGGTNQPIDGEMEIFQGLKLIVSLRAIEYALVTDKLQVQPTGLITGSGVSGAYQKYREQTSEYYGTLLPGYNQKLQSYQNAAADNLQRAINKLPLIEIHPPIKPSPPLPVVSAPGSGFIIRLKAGRYQIRMVDNQGSIIPGSQRNLEVFDPLQNGVGYEILPQSRWTNPVTSEQPGSTIYWGPESVLFIKPFKMVEYNDYQYTHLKTPQSSVGDLDERVWIPGDPIVDGQIELECKGGIIQSIPQKDYMVNQLPGSGLGYTIDEVTGPLPTDDPSISIPTFRAIKLDLNANPTVGTIRLISSSGQKIIMSERTIYKFRPIGNLFTILFPITILLIGAMVVLTRKRLTSIKSRS